MFERVVVGIDGSRPSVEALAQALRLMAPNARLLAVTGFLPELGVHTGVGASRAAEQLAEEAHSAHGEARRLLEGVPNAEALLVHAEGSRALLRCVREAGADLVAVGSHGGSRAAGIVFGSVATAMLHEAPCSVLVARSCSAPDRFPRAIVVGDDGSRVAGAAVRLAEHLAERAGAKLRTVIALGGKHVTVSHVVMRPSLEHDERAPVEALCARAAEADLIVVGSRGLHGVASLGSVSERLAHRASCSVLVVRPADGGGEEQAGE